MPRGQCIISTEGNLSNSMRANYSTHGIEEYYKTVSSSYRNPHVSGIRQCLYSWLNSWWAGETEHIASLTEIFILDMACGSGEATVSVLEWWQLGKLKHSGSAIKPQTIPSVTASSSGWRPPQSSRASTTPKARIPFLPPQTPMPKILATDPYTSEAYGKRTSRTCHPLSFRDISQGELPPPFDRSGLESAHENDSETTPRALEMVVCSFALHLIETSELFALLWELSSKARWLIILAPHKKPEIKHGWGWQLWDPVTWRACDDINATARTELLIERVHCRVYRSTNLW